MQDTVFVVLYIVTTQYFNKVLKIKSNKEMTNYILE